VDPDDIERRLQALYAIGRDRLNPNPADQAATESSTHSDPTPISTEPSADAPLPETCSHLSCPRCGNEFKDKNKFKRHLNIPTKRCLAKQVFLFKNNETSPPSASSTLGTPLPSSDKTATSTSSSNNNQDSCTAAPTPITSESILLRLFSAKMIKSDDGGKDSVWYKRCPGIIKLLRKQYALPEAPLDENS
jgi:hypothetical protein